MEDSFHLIMQIIQRKYNNLFALFYILIQFPISLEQIVKQGPQYMFLRTYLHHLSRIQSQQYPSRVKLGPDCIQFYCSTAKPKLNHRLSSLQQQALCSFTIINIIMHFSRQDSIKEGMSLRELIINRQKFNYLAALALNN